GRFLRREGRAVQLLRQRAAVHELQGEVVSTGLLTDLVDLDDARVVETGDGLSLDPEAGQLFGGSVLPGEDQFEGDQALEPDVPRLVDDAHAAAPQLSQYFVAGDDDRPRGRRDGDAVRLP